MTVASSLSLGGSRYLNLRGDVVTREGFMLGAEEIGPDTRAFWEETARRGGHDLDDLLRQQ